MPVDEPQTEHAQYFGLAELLRVLARRWRWIAGSMLLLLAIAIFISTQQQKEYVATTRLLMRTVASDTSLIADPNAQVPFFADRQLANQIQLMESAQVRAAVEEAYDGNADIRGVSASIVETGSDAVELSITSSDPKGAAELTNLWAAKYIEITQSERLDTLEAANAEVEARIASVNEQRAAVAEPLTRIQEELAANPGNVDLQRERAVIVAQIQPDLDALDQLLALYTRTRENLALTANLAPTSVTQILNRAGVPTDPVTPKPIRDGIIGLMAGFGIGIGLALAREFLDQSIRTSDDLERVIKGRYPVLGVIPEVGSSEIGQPMGPGTQTPVAEAYRALRTSVRFAELDGPIKVIQVTSAAAGEGKTTTAANLARMLTQAGHRVAIACCDLRRPTIHDYLGVPLAPGLADVVVGERSLAEAISQADALTYVLPAGSPPPNPSELLGSSRAERVIGALAEEMDYTVLDTTPVLPVTDSIVVSRFADATLLVVRAGSTTRKELEQALTSLELASAPIIGIVLNRANPGDRNAYGYDYAYGPKESYRPPVEPASGPPVGSPVG
jgi:succinoglycan biosynthesis transport protein ExoP